MTPGEPQFAADYDDRTTAAVKTVLIEIGQILGRFNGKFAIVGGAVPWLLLGNEEMPHVGTLDVDLGLDAQALGDGEYATLIEAPQGHGYQRRRELRRFQLVRQILTKDVLGDRSPEQWQQDVFGQVDAWLRSLGLRCCFRLKLIANEKTVISTIERYIHSIGIEKEAQMSSTAKLFITGRNQAVRLPREFRFAGAKVFVRRNPATGEVVISPKPTSWEGVFSLANRTDIPADFLADREDLRAEGRNI